MKVVILCGGVGSRMKEETEFRPKPMVMIGEKPILWHIMKHYAHFGFRDFVLALGYKGEMIREYFINYQLFNQDFTITLGKGHREVEVHETKRIDDWRVTLVDTGLSALKGARIKRIEKYVPQEDTHFLMTYGDGVCNLDLNQLIAYHHSHGKLVTLTGVIPSMRFGEITARPDGAVNFREKDPSRAAMINGGYYVVDRKIFQYLEDRDDQDFEYGPLEELSDKGEVMMRRHHDFWHCMDHLRDAEALNKMWGSGHAPWKLWEN
ncbi:MAG: glucose-1-phosphate cytidylyltransferase [Candidatus Hydrogenedentes bacterium]|nr:glucose-1-phosphate cytidylyltransferase [Candidatus Hydrogenedentota bacterium]